MHCTLNTYTQSNQLRQLKQAYEELVEGSRRLLDTKASLIRAGIIDPLPKMNEQQPVRLPVEPKPPAMARPSSVPNVRGNVKAPKLSDDVDVDVQQQQSVCVESVVVVGGNLTFITSDLDDNERWL